MSTSNPVLFVTRHYRPELIGSAPFCSDLAEWLALAGRKVSVLTGLPYYPGTEVFPTHRNFRGERQQINGVEVNRLRSRIPSNASAASRILSEGSFLLAGIRRLLTSRKARADTVLSLCPSIMTVALGCVMKRRGGRHVAIVHDIQSGLAQGLGLVGGSKLVRLMQWVEKSVLNRVDLIAVPTETMAEKLRELGVRSKIEILPIWVDTAVFRLTACPQGAQPRLLYSGNLGMKQGLGQIIALAQELERRECTAEIIIRGDGSLREKVRAEIDAFGLRHVRLEPLLAPELLSNGLAEGDIHLVPQEPDAAAFAIPSKIFNIMAVGRPFVVTARPGSPLWKISMQSQASLCVPPNEPAEFASAVIRLIDDVELRQTLGRRGRNFVERNYARSQVLGDFLDRLDALHAAP